MRFWWDPCPWAHAQGCYLDHPFGVRDRGKSNAIGVSEPWSRLKVWHAALLLGEWDELFRRHNPAALWLGIWSIQ